MAVGILPFLLTLCLAASAAPSAKPRKTEDGSVIYAPGLPPERDSSLVLKRSSLSRSPLMRVGSKVGVSVWEGTRTRGNFLRLMLRTGQSGLELQDLYVVVECFGQNPSTSRTAHVTPHRSLVRIIKLDGLSTASQYMDLSPMAAAESHEGFHGDSYNHTYRSGTEYYGAIISAFSSEGDLLYQGATKPQLGQRAQAKCPHLRLVRAEEEEQRLHESYEAAKQARTKDRDDPAAKAAYDRARDEHRAARSRTKAVRAALD